MLIEMIEKYGPFINVLLKKLRKRILIITRAKYNISMKIGY